MKLRQARSKKESKDLIVWRGHEVLRIEAFSDAIFAFAITLLIVSLEVPKNFQELLEMMKGFLPFAISFALFFQIWTAQNLFFRRYGLHDEPTIALNATLLFLVLFFVYPLKFLWSSLLHVTSAFKNVHEVADLFCIYGGGFAAIYFLFAAMYWYAYRKRDKLKLTDSEVFETRTYIYRYSGTAMVGVFSIFLAFLGGPYVAFAGICYSLIGVVVGVTHSKRGKLHRRKFPVVETPDNFITHLAEE